MGKENKILMITTGGTIASVESDEGLVPGLSAEELLGQTPGLEGIEFDTMSIMNLDSSNIQPEEWRIIALSVFDNRDKYKGIVITHGTDTMAYTASMLSYMLLGINIPVVLTGSQIPMGQENSDAPANLRDAFLTANSDIPAGIYVAFNGNIILGSRASKVRTTSFNAFESINLENAADIVNNEVIVNDWVYDKPFVKNCVLRDNLEKDVFLLKLVPGTSEAFFKHFHKMGYKGLVIEAFGIGGLHYIRRDIPDAIEQLLDKGIEVVVISQCLYEISDFTVYEVGQKTITSGVIPGHDMTTEAAVTKLMWAMKNTRQGQSVSDLMQLNLSGEVFSDEKKQVLDI